MFDNSDIAEIKNDTYSEAFNKLGLTAMNISEREMFVGYEKLNDFKKKAKFNVISSNIVFDASNKPVFATELILKEKVDKIGIVKIGILGFTRAIPSTWQTAAGDKIKTADVIEVAKKMVPELSKKVDLLIVLARLEHQETVNLATEVSGIDVILATYGGERTTAEPFKVKDTLVFYNGYEGKWLGELRLVLDKKKKISASENNYIFFTKEYTDDPEMAKIVNTAQEKISAFYQKRAEEQRKLQEEQQKQQQQQPPPPQPPPAPQKDQQKPPGQP